MMKQKSFDKLQEKGTLFLVPTPIGNLEDMTFRAIHTLKHVSMIASEDTRNTQKLLNHFEIITKQISFHEHNFHERIPEFIQLLQEGKDLAQVSDAGMPSISDPGHELVVACIESNIPVVSLPGATAGVTALIASGLPADQFFFYGFLPRKKKQQQEVLTTLNNRTETMIFYESPHRVKQTIDNMLAVFEKERNVVVCRELTKIHEEYVRGTLAELSVYLEDSILKGECCLLVEGTQQQNDVDESEWKEWTIEEHIQEVMEKEELTSKDAIKKVAKLRGIKKQEAYKNYHQF